jgi:Methyltransferase FkbM domain
MKRRLRSITASAMRFLNARSRGWRVTRATSTASVIDLLHRLHPILPEQGLVRLGPAGDGGYLLPDDLDGIAACFSPGVGTLSGFELDCADRGMRTHLADGSVAGPALDDPRLRFSRLDIRAIAENGAMTLDHWVESSEPDPSEDLLLQMDVEGDEWEILLSTPTEILRRFRIIVVEFHRLQGLLEQNSFPLMALALRKLLATHVCVHIHPNNYHPMVRSGGLEIPPNAEFTFLRADRIDAHQRPFATTFPHPLDEDCTDNPSTVLPRWMWRS